MLSDVDINHARIEAQILGQDPATDPFVAAVRATRIPVVFTDPRLPDNPIVFVNDAFCRLTGYPRDAVVGRNCRFLQGPGTDADSVRRIRKAVRAGESIEIDIRNYRADATPFWSRLSIAPVRDETGQVAYFFANQVDVTIERERLAGLESRNASLIAELRERLRAQEESQARLRFATQARGLGVWERDLRNNELTASALCKATFGRDPAAAFSFADLREAVHPDDRERVQTAIAHSVSTGGDYNIEYRVLRPDSSVGWVEVHAQVVHAADATPLRMAGTSLDITGRKKAERRSRALMDLDDRFRRLDLPGDLAFAAAEILGQTLGVSRVGYGTTDLATETIAIERAWNAPGIESLAAVLHFRDYGSYIEDLKRGETVIVANAEKDARTAATANALRAISAQSFINMPVTEQEGLVALLYITHAVPREWPAEELAFIREIAQRTRMAVERRRAEQDLRRLTVSLEAQIAARTQELMETEAALRQSQKMEAVGQLTGGIAHDFNNLLTGILGSLELLKARVAQGRLFDLDRYVTAAYGAATRAAALTHRLLAFSRQQTLEPKVVNINRLVRDMEELVCRTMGPAIAVEVVGSVGLWATRIDPSQLENALLNLCINARDAMPDGGKLTIETGNQWLDDRAGRGRDLPPGQYVTLSVSDTGSGMAPKVIAKAFDPFFTTKPIGQGTGLGLSMVYGFARQSGGQARIYSEPGQGTMVRLYLPRDANEIQEEPASAHMLEVPFITNGETVLVVDDEPTLRMLVTDVLEDYGYATLEAENALVGLERVRSGARIDLLLSDVGLPGGMNGRQLADAARALRPDLKVLFITGYAENAVLSHGHLAPGMHVMTKPFAMEALAIRIKELLSHH